MEALKNSRTWRILAITALVLAVVYFGYLGAVVSPEKNTEDLPIAVVNADQGAKVGGKEVNFGEQVVKKLTGSDSPAGKKVEWTRLENREKALESLGEKEYYGAIVIPKDYSEQLAKLSAPQGASRGPSSGQPTGEVPANLRTPEPAKIEVFTNPAAGQSASGLAQDINSSVVQRVSQTTSQRMVEAAQKQGASVPPAFAAVLGNPVRADVIEAEPIGPDSGGGNTAFFLPFLGVISGLIGAGLAYFLVSGVPGGSTGSPPVALRAKLFPAKLVLGIAFAGMVAALESVVALGFWGVDHSVNVFWVFLWLWLAIASVMAITLLFLEAFGVAGQVLSALLLFLFGQIASGGIFPLESLPSFYRAYADVLPLRYAVDGMRSLLFYDGRMDAGLETALLVLGAYLLGSAALGYAISVVRARQAEEMEVFPAAGRMSRQEELLLVGTALEYISRRVESEEGASPGLVRAVSNLMRPGEGAISERERAIEASRQILRPLSRIFLRGYLPADNRESFGEEGGRA